MTERTRHTIYTTLAGALAIAVLIGRITTDQSAIILEAIAAVLTVATALAMIVAARHVTEDTWSTARRALYAASAAILAVLGVFGIVTPELAATSLAIVAEVLQVAGVVLLGTAASKVPPEGARRAIKD